MVGVFKARVLDETEKIRGGDIRLLSDAVSEA